MLTAARPMLPRVGHVVSSGDLPGSGVWIDGYVISSYRFCLSQDCCDEPPLAAEVTKFAQINALPRA